jgi:membrane protein DedA with SNARE-associated domain
VLQVEVSIARDVSDHHVCERRYISEQDMPTIVTDLSILASQNHFLAYFILYLAGIFVGNITAFTGFWLVLGGYLGIWGAPLLLVVLFLSDVTGDVTWYSLGRALRETRFGTFIKTHLPRHQKIEDHLTKNSRRWIFLSKFIYASAFPILFVLGWCTNDFKKFLRTNILATLFWLPVLSVIAVTLVSALNYFQVVAVFKRLEFVFLLGLIIFVAIQYAIVRIVAKIFGR